MSTPSLAYGGSSYNPYVNYYNQSGSDQFNNNFYSGYKSDVPVAINSNNGTFYKDPNSSGVYFVAYNGQVFYNRNATSAQYQNALTLPSLNQQQQQQYATKTGYNKEAVTQARLDLAANFSDIIASDSLADSLLSGVANGNRSGGTVGAIAGAGENLTDSGSLANTGFQYVGSFANGNKNLDIGKGVTNLGIKYGANYLVNNTASGSTLNTFGTLVSKYSAAGGGVNGAVNAGFDLAASKIASTAASTATTTASTATSSAASSAASNGGSAAASSSSLMMNASVSGLGIAGAVVAGFMGGGSATSVALSVVSYVFPIVGIVLLASAGIKKLFGNNVFSSAVAKVVEVFSKITEKSWDITRRVLFSEPVKILKSVWNTTKDVGSKLLKGDIGGAVKAGVKGVAKGIKSAAKGVKNIVKKLKFW